MWWAQFWDMHSMSHVESTVHGYSLFSPSASSQYSVPIRLGQMVAQLPRYLPRKPPGAGDCTTKPWHPNCSRMENAGSVPLKHNVTVVRVPFPQALYETSVGEPKQP